MNVVPPPAVGESGGMTEYRWEAREVAAIEVDDQAPYWFDPLPRVDLSEFESWQEVAGWAADVFATVDTDDEAIDAIVAEWTAELPELEDRALAAITFIQDEVRYLGIEIGPNSHRPYPPGQVLARRFGDCKDKALLLTVMLRKLGIEAKPALVNTFTGESLESRLPSPFAFDHVILLISWKGQPLWIDATSSEQGGRLETRAVPPLERALVVDRGETALRRIEPRTPLQPTTVIEERYAVPKYGGEARLSVTTEYIGEDADSLRASLAVMSPADLAKSYLEHYEATDRNIVAVTAPEVEDDRRANRIVVKEEYRIPQFWTGREREFYPWSMDDWLVEPRVVRRKAPLAVGWGGHVEHRIVVDLPDRFEIEDGAETVDDPAFRYDGSWRLDGKTLRLTYRYRSGRAVVAPERVSEYAGNVKRARESLGYQIWYDGEGSGAIDRASALPAAAWAGVMGGSLIVFALLLVPLVAIWKGFRASKSRPEAASRFTARTPASAIAVDSAADLANRLSAFRCHCGGVFDGDADEVAHVHYLGCELTVVSRRCAACRGADNIYFRVGL